ncbi:predicted protein [Nematostella vectensis]|uniref:Carbonic anhydrase n=1 Tax=Nematostella vectensis TaxID=45351 RepID=A7S717_NEMVE|nr:predicted protein [Nematostella vectensis]|eukprot:XP_001632619.1 predicted protein [Nematostella vectensis]
MEKILQGVVRFRHVLRPSLLPSLREVAEKVAPKTVLVACVDCRIMPETYMSSEPGDMFVVRTAGNLLPHAKLYGDVGSCSELAALQMAIQEGKVENVVVCGHSNCKGMTFLLSHDSRTDNHYIPWLKKTGASSLTRFEKVDMSQEGGVKLLFEDATGGEPMEVTIDEGNKLDSVDKLSQVNVLQQLHNLKSFPFISNPLSKGALNLYGLWFDIKEGEMYMFSRKQKKFVLINKDTVNNLCSEVD